MTEEINKVGQAYQRPWGYYRTVAQQEGYQVKEIVVNPGGKLSLQSHHHRSEHWVVVQGVATITIDDQTGSFGVNESVYIPKETKHRLANEGDERVILIEVQVGDYLGEDDIVRYEDLYHRTT